ncbi:MAG TPA: RNA polymerase sigma factor [Solirubrobacteraceae bacterium]
MDTGGAPRDDGRPSQGGSKISTVTAAPALRRDGDDITDNDLVARVRAGDDRAFERLYTRYHRRIASYIQGMVHDHARAEDIAQDVFMSALRRMRETDRPIAFKPWVYEIAKNACIDQFRRARRAEEVSMDADEGLGSADYGRLVSSTPTPDVAHDHKQQIDHLRGAFGGLSETHHEILVMRELEGLSYREIGEKLGMTRPAVESTLFRARRRLTEEYDELVTGERCVRVQQIIATAAGSALGTRDKRRVARHVSYCQPCMRHARMSGLDAGDLVHKPVRQKIAAFLPLPAFLKDRIAGHEASASFAQWSTQASSVDPSLVATWGKAAATAATIAIAGVSAGVATNREGVLPDSLGGVSFQSITGQDNPGGSGGDATVAAGSGSRSGSAAGGSAASGATGAGGARGSSSTSAADGGSGSGSGSATADGSGAGSGSDSGSGDGSASGDGVAALGGAGSGTSASGSGGDAGDTTGDAGTLLSSLGGSGDGDSSNGSGPNKGGNDGGDTSGGDEPAIEIPSVSVPAATGGGDTGGGDGAAKPNGSNNGDGQGADNADGGDTGSPVENIGDKSAEVIGGLVGG